MGSDGIYGGKGQVKEVYLQIFFDGRNWNGWTDRQRQNVPKRRGTRVRSSCTSIDLDPRDWHTIIIVWSQWTGRNRCGQHGGKINRLFFTQGFVGQQIYLEKYSKPYRQPMQGTKQWNTARKWRRLCHQAGKLILYTLKRVYNYDTFAPLFLSFLHFSIAEKCSYPHSLACMSPTSRALKNFKVGFIRVNNSSMQLGFTRRNEQDQISCLYIPYCSCFNIWFCRNIRFTFAIVKASFSVFIWGFHLRLHCMYNTFTLLLAEMY